MNDKQVQHPSDLLAIAGRARPPEFPYFVLDGVHRLVEAADIVECARWFQNHREAAVVGRDEFHYGEQPVVLSTIFLSFPLDRVPDGRFALYESAVFGGPLDGAVQRYASWEEAEVGHHQMKARLKRALQAQGPEYVQ